MLRASIVKINITMAAEEVIFQYFLFDIFGKCCFSVIHGTFCCVNLFLQTIRKKLTPLTFHHINEYA